MDTELAIYSCSCHAQSVTLQMRVLNYCIS